MSKIVDFRDRIVQAVKTLFPEMDVEWYDGLFDETDIAEWTLKTPCARVAVMNAPGEHEVTGEINACLRVVVVIIDDNRRAALDGDARAWEYVENTAIMANLNTFGDPNAAPATKVKFRRISQPVLRREGVAVGVVEWESDLTIGRNRVREREFFYRPDGSMITDVPRTSYIRGDAHFGHVSRHEEVELDLNEE
ncbi:hypothetical protein [Bradyrhizobium ottawaense]|uniref:Uncharacterized protein n=1 Tax=Bradyrhizobium ottawaense TaxID=931866 RepID=A0ABY0QH83_9BRAD|nr:hypothetical protein [Bradyrhizobium ottawaense]SDK40502.1 hypothetical protein SAMN05444163_8034 [Bradyrhizobium ottawaense]